MILLMITKLTTVMHEDGSDDVDHHRHSIQQHQNECQRQVYIAVHSIFTEMLPIVSAITYVRFNSIHPVCRSIHPFLCLTDCQRVNQRLLLLVGCLRSQQHACVSQGRICSDSFTCCHTEIEVVDQTFHLTQAQYTDTGPTSPSTEPIAPGAWQGSHWSAIF